MGFWVFIAFMGLFFLWDEISKIKKKQFLQSDAYSVLQKELKESINQTVICELDAYYMYGDYTPQGHIRLYVLDVDADWVECLILNKKETQKTLIRISNFKKIISKEPKKNSA